MQTVVPMVSSYWASLNLILLNRCNEKDLIQATCQLIQSSIAFLIMHPDCQQEQVYENLSKNLLVCFQTNNHNTQCIKTLAIISF